MTGWVDTHTYRFPVGDREQIVEKRSDGHVYHLDAPAGCDCGAWHVEGEGSIFGLAAVLARIRASVPPLTPFRRTVLPGQRTRRERVAALAEGPLDGSARSLESWRQTGWPVEPVRWLRPGQAVIADGTLYVSEEQVCPDQPDAVVEEWLRLEAWRLAPRRHQYPCGG